LTSCISASKRQVNIMTRHLNSVWMQTAVSYICNHNQKFDTHLKLPATRIWLQSTDFLTLSLNLSYPGLFSRITKISWGSSARAFATICRVAASCGLWTLALRLNLYPWRLTSPDLPHGSVIYAVWLSGLPWLSPILSSRSSFALRVSTAWDIVVGNEQVVLIVSEAQIP